MASFLLVGETVVAIRAVTGTLSLFFNCASEVINTTEKVASFPFTISESMAHGLPHEFLATARTMNIHMCLQCLHMPKTFAGSPVAAQAKDINSASGVTGETNTSMDPSSWLAYGHQHSLGWKHRP